MTMPEGQGAPPPAGYPGATPPGPEPGYQQPSYPQSGPPYVQAPPLKPQQSGRRTGLLILGTLVVVIGLILGGLYLFRDRISGNVNELAAGDCIDEPSSTTSITDVQHQPCTEPHDGEVFALIVHPAANGAAYPGTDAFRTLVVQQCLPQVQTYTGRTLEEIDSAGLTYAWFYPTTSSWTDSNDRGITCYLARQDEQKMTGSVRAAGGAGGASHSP
jgi:hypothetical protein